MPEVLLWVWPGWETLAHSFLLLAGRGAPDLGVVWGSGEFFVWPLALAWLRLFCPKEIMNTEQQAYFEGTRKRGSLFKNKTKQNKKKPNPKQKLKGVCSFI